MHRTLRRVIRNSGLNSPRENSLIRLRSTADSAASLHLGDASAASEAVLPLNSSALNPSRERVKCTVTAIPMACADSRRGLLALKFEVAIPPRRHIEYLREFPLNGRRALERGKKHGAGSDNHELRSGALEPR